MHLEGRTRIETSRKTLWHFLTDPQEVGLCLPGLKSIEVRDPDKEFRFLVAPKLGSIQATFELDVSMTSALPHSQARLVVRGKGPNTHLGISSFLMLKECGGDETEMEWSFDLTASGLIANLGERVLEQAAYKLAEEFLDRVRTRVTSREEVHDETQGASTESQRSRTAARSSDWKGFEM